MLLRLRQTPTCVGKKRIRSLLVPSSFAKPVATAFDDRNIRRDESGGLLAYTTFSKEQLDNAPQYDKQGYKTHRDEMRLHTQS